MKVSLDELQQMFNLLIEEKKSREEIANWAVKLQFACDDGNLEFDPLTEEDKIWEGISYLTGVDLLNIDGSYLHSIENFVDFKNSIGL